MIASFGGAEVDARGNLNYPGSGGLVGGLSQPGGNWAYWNGAGKQYNRFTPNYTGSLPNGLICLDCADTSPGGGGGVIPIDYPDNPSGTSIDTSGGNTTSTSTTTTPTSTPTTSTPGGTVTNCFWGDCTITSPTNIPVITSPNDILNSIKDFLTPAPKTNVATPPVLFSFIPSSTDTGLNMKNVIILAVVAVVAYFAWKKFA